MFSWGSLRTLRLPFASFAVKLFANEPFNRKGRKDGRKERKGKLPLLAQDGNTFGASDTTISFPVANCSLISMWRLRKCERARSPQARTK